MTAHLVESIYTEHTYVPLGINFDGNATFQCFLYNPVILPAGHQLCWLFIFSWQESKETVLKLAFHWQQLINDFKIQIRLK